MRHRRCAMPRAARGATATRHRAGLEIFARKGLSAGLLHGRLGRIVRTRRLRREEFSWGAGGGHDGPSSAEPQIAFVVSQVLDEMLEIQNPARYEVPALGQDGREESRGGFGRAPQ